MALTVNFYNHSRPTTFGSSLLMQKLQIEVYVITFSIRLAEACGLLETVCLHYKSLVSNECRGVNNHFGIKQ